MNIYKTLVVTYRYFSSSTFSSQPRTSSQLCYLAVTKATDSSTIFLLQKHKPKLRNNQGEKFLLFSTHSGRRVFISFQTQRREPGTYYKFIYFHLLRLKWTTNTFRLVVKIVHSLFSQLQEPISYKSHLS